MLEYAKRKTLASSLSSKFPINVILVFLEIYQYFFYLDLPSVQYSSFSKFILDPFLSICFLLF